MPEKSAEDTQRNYQQCPLKEITETHIQGIAADIKEIKEDVTGITRTLRGYNGQPGLVSEFVVVKRVAKWAIGIATCVALLWIKSEFF